MKLLNGLEKNMENYIRFAFAVNEQNQFHKKHFGDADKYLIYELVDDQFIDISEEVNIFKDIDEVETHGSKKKGDAIIHFLKEKGVRVLVSQQFGKNIKMVNQHFVPVIVTINNVDKTKQELLKQIKWLKDELTIKRDNYMLFKIGSGAVKSKIDK